MQRVRAAEDYCASTVELELLQRKKTQNKLSRRQRYGENFQSKQSILILERKLVSAIRYFHAEVNSDGRKLLNVAKCELKTRDLLPSYTMADVENFLNIFSRADKGYSGDLDENEWVDFFTKFNKSMTPLAARQLFSSVDLNHDGSLSVRELVPIVFAKASPEQIEKISNYLEFEVAKNVSDDTMDLARKEDVALLFETYDVAHTGYIPVKLLRDKLVFFQLPIAAQLFFNEKLKNMEEDDMLSLTEFLRIFIPYLSLSQEPKENSLN
jgi:Ca2+-binding EF-hand superfamily protein